MSRTVTITDIIPDLGGVPPTSSGTALSPFCVTREKYSFGLSL
uniref:Uncharacterized protein n=1 Tax=Oryzias melastigma TaxID=30732 RepID=A0A3B3DG40_ORYME